MLVIVFLVTTHIPVGALTLKQIGLFSVRNLVSSLPYADKIYIEDYDKNKLPVVYHEGYNVTFGKKADKLFSWFHPFDGNKYKKITQKLIDEGVVVQDQWYTPEIVSDEELLLVHSQKYLYSLNDSGIISKAVDMGSLLKLMPNSTLQRRFLDPMKYATGGTILAARLAIKYGWSINIGGGFHHAKRNFSEGGCVFQDVPLAIVKLRQELNNDQLRVLIVDLDAHQGNGFADYAKDDPYTFVFDMYNKNEKPYEEALEKYIEFNFPLDGGHLESRIGPFNIDRFDKLDLLEQPVDRRVDDDYYFSILRTQLPRAIKILINQGNKPDLIVFNAGSDPHVDDPWGCMAISDEGIMARDSFVFELAFGRNIPIMMVQAGGYGSRNADLVFRSIRNILKNVTVQN